MRIANCRTANRMTQIPVKSWSRGDERHADWRGSAKLRGERIGALPVVDGGHLVGILTGTNILDALTPSWHLQRKIERGVSDESQN